jgi:hypothetical protein
MRLASLLLLLAACTEPGDGFDLTAHITSTVQFDTAIVVEDSGTPQTRSLGAPVTTWDYTNGGLFSGPARLQITIQRGGNDLATATASNIEYQDDNGTAVAEITLPVNP